MTDVVGDAVGVSSLADALLDRVELRIGGMTCGACANRVERTLNKLVGVTATVNYATEKASVRFAAPVTVDDLVRAVEKAGYTAEPPAPEVQNAPISRLKVSLFPLWDRLGDDES